MNQNNKLPDAMTDLPTCPACGAPLAPGRSGEMCPACLLHAAMGADLPDQFASPGAGVAGDHGFPSIAERLGARIGRYKLLEQIGEGGFGVVWMNMAGEAREALRKATELTDTKLPTLDSGDLGPSWHDWIIAQTLLREVKALLGDDAKTGDETKVIGP